VVDESLQEAIAKRDNEIAAVPPSSPKPFAAKMRSTKTLELPGLPEDQGKVLID
jgi:hypothetical protein